MRSFFRALEERHVRFLLISGQAAVAYGASTFSEDVDLWIDPAVSNWSQLLGALEAASARIYKLTPPLDPKLARRGHGFHFTLPDDDSPGLVGYLDVMGRPPRVGSFPACAKRAHALATDWGKLPVLAPGDLALVKRTRRLADYAVISALVRRVVTDAKSSQETWAWAIDQTFDAEDLLGFWQGARRSWRDGTSSRRAAIAWMRAEPAKPEALSILSALLATEMEAHREADRRYWAPIIDELKTMQREKRLLRVGTPVERAAP